MKKSSSFSFTQVAASAAKSKNLNFSQVAAAAASSKSKKPNSAKSSNHHYNNKVDKKSGANVEKSLNQWEEFREKKLDMAKIQKQGLERRQRADDTSLIKYNHQESVQAPLLKPRNQSQHKLTRHQREREQMREHARYHHRRKFSLDPNWYTENVFTNQSYDDSDCDSIKRPLTTSASFPHYNTRSNRYSSHKNDFHRIDFNGNNRTNNININISNTANTKLHGHSSSFEDEAYDINAKYFQRHQNYPKSHSCSFAERYHRREADTEVMPDARSRSVPKSHSFSNSNQSVMRQCDMDLIEYQRYKRMMAQRYRDRGPSTSEPVVRRICDREGCFSDTCLVKNVNNSQNISINNNIINNNSRNSTRIINEWDLRNKNSEYRDAGDDRRRFPRETLIDDIDTFDDDDFIFNDGFSFQEFPCQPLRPSRTQRPYRNPYFSSMRFANFSDHFYRRNRIHDRELDDLFRRERSKVLLRNKFDKLNKYSDDFNDDYQKSYEDLFVDNRNNQHGNNLKPSKTMLEVKVPNKYDDTESDSTDLDLDDFNLDFEKYWEELEEKNLSTTSTLELAEQNEIFDSNNNHINAKISNDANNNPVSFIDDFFKPTKFSPLNSKRQDYFQKILPPKKMNITSTARPLGIVTPHDDFLISMKRPLTLNNFNKSPFDTPPLRHHFHDENMETAKFQIIPNKTGLKISPLYNFEHDHFNNTTNSFNNVFYENCNNLINKGKNKLKSTARPLLFW